MTTREDTIRHLFSLSARDIKYDLVRITEAARILGEPQRAYRCIHVAGTNGKGSVCAMLDSILRAHGRRAGLYTSPHLVDFEERIIFNGRTIATDEWLAVYEEIAPRVEHIKLSFFEITTLLAFELFRRAGVEWAVLETGMGGRLDATNIVLPAVSVITSISMDHAEFLGNTVPAIATEKLGIVKRGVPLVMIRPSVPEVERRAREVAEKLSAPLHFIEHDMAGDVRFSLARPSFEWAGSRYQVPLAGRYQAVNALCALQACALAGLDDADACVRGIAGAFIPGRFQILDMHGKTVVFDIAHNPEASAVFADTMAARFAGKRVCLVVGIMKDKDTRADLRSLCRVAGRLVLTRPDTPRSCEAGDLAAQLPREWSGPRDVVPDVGQAVQAALQSDADVVGIVGSCHTVGDAMKALGIKPYPPATDPASWPGTGNALRSAGDV